MPRGPSKRRLPDSLTQHLSDPKIVAIKPRTTNRRGARRGSGLAQKIAVSAVTLIVLSLAGGYLLRLL
jgi:hypothetical protein